MKVSYKIEGKKVDREIFNRIVNNQQVFSVWENVIENNKTEIEKQSAAIVFKIADDNFHVITDNGLLFKLAYEVKGMIQNYHTKQVIPQKI